MIKTIYPIVIGLAFLASLVSFRYKLPRHLRLFSVLLGITFLVELFAVYGIKWFHLKNNLPLYNVFVLFEFSLYGIYYLYIVKPKAVRVFIKAFLLLYPVFWFVTVFYVFGGLHNWNSYINVAGSLFTVTVSAAYYFQLFTAPQLVRLSRHTEFWIATGMILFYACNLPYVGTLNFLIKNYYLLAKQLLFVLQLLVITMYSIFLYAYLCQVAIRK